MDHGLRQAKPQTMPRGRRAAGAGMTTSAQRTATAVPAQVREQIDRWAGRWLRKFSLGLELRAADPGPFNYPVAVFAEWRGKSFYLAAKYRTPSGRPEDDFVARTARMMSSGFGRFDLAYFRHTDRWCTVRSGLTANACFAEIEANEVFWPMV